MMGGLRIAGGGWHYFAAAQRIVFRGAKIFQSSYRRCRSYRHVNQHLGRAVSSCPRHLHLHLGRRLAFGLYNYAGVALE